MLHLRGVALSTVLLPALLFAAERRLELRGQIEPPPRRASITIHGANTPFTSSAVSGSKGRFRFRNLQAGTYTISVFVPGRGEVRRTIEVSPALADWKGRVTVTIPYHPSKSASSQSLESKHTVSLRELSIPDRARAEYKEAQRRLGKYNVAAAVEHLKRAVEIAPQFMAAWNNLGTIAYQSGQYRDAEKYFRKALEQEPGAFEPVVNLGGVLLNLLQYHEALKYNRYAVQEKPRDALANSQLGMNYFFLGDEDQALRYLKSAKRLDPSHFSHPQLILAEIYLQRADRRAAIRELRDFLARHPDAPEAERVRKQLKKLSGQ